MRMFSCIRSRGGSGHRKPKRPGWFRPGWFRRVLRSIYGHLCPFSRRENEDDMNLEDEPIFDPKSPTYLKDIINYIPKAMKDGNYLFIYIVLAVYPKFVTTWEMLALIMDTYGPLDSDYVEDQEKKTALFSFLYMWRAKHPQDFLWSPDLDVAKRLVKYLWPDEPANDLTIPGEGLEKPESKKNDGLLREINPEAPMQDASGMAESLHLEPTSVAAPQEFLKIQDGTDLVVGEPTMPEDGPVPLQTSDQPLPTEVESPLAESPPAESPLAESPLEVAADVPILGTSL